MAFFKEYLSCEADDSSYFKDPNSEMQAELYLFMMVYIWRLFILV